MPSLFTVSTQLPILMSYTLLHCEMLLPMVHTLSLLIEFSRQGYWSGLPFSSPGDFPDPGIELRAPASLALQVDSLPSEPQGKPITPKLT